MPHLVIKLKTTYILMKHIGRNEFILRTNSPRIYYTLTRLYNSVLVVNENVNEKLKKK